MLKLEGLKLTPEEMEAALHRKAARLLRIPEEDVLSVQVLRRSIDAREELHLVYTVAAEVRQEKQVLRRCRDRRVSRYAPERYALPEILSPPEVPPEVVGTGPGGLFAALVLARCGLRPILLERGQDTVTRQRDVETFWRTGGVLFWQGSVLAAVLLVLTRWVKQTKNWHPIVFIGLSALVGVVFRFAGA